MRQFGVTSVAFCVLSFVLTAPAHAALQLPKAMVGVWASDPAACADVHSELRMTVEPRSVLFYETAYTVGRVSRLRDGFWRAFGTSVSEMGDDRAPATLMLKLVSADRLQVGRPDGQIYHRCKRRT